MREVPSSSTCTIPQQFSHTTQESGHAREQRTSSFSDGQSISELHSVGGGTMTAMMSSSCAMMPSMTSWLTSSLLRASQLTCQSSPTPYHSKLVIRPHVHNNNFTLVLCTCICMRLLLSFEFNNSSMVKKEKEGKN